jgi:hypothetical protein
MSIRYEWHGDERYNATVIDRYYAQVPFLLRLRSQATVIWIVFTGPLLFIEDVNLEAKGIWLVFATALAFAFAPFVRRGILLKYRLRPSFGSQTSFVMNANEVVLTGVGSGHFPWTVYKRAVRFSDGILLARPGAIRWLPDTALAEGTASEALEIVREKMPLRDLSL